MMMGVAFLSGMSAAMFLTAGLFFLKFWRASRNRFFAFFASACWLFAFERAISLCTYLLMDPELYENLEARGWVYIIRLAGFTLILIAIVDRNRSAFAQRKAVRRMNER